MGFILSGTPCSVGFKTPLLQGISALAFYAGDLVNKIKAYFYRSIQNIIKRYNKVGYNMDIVR